MADDNAMTLKVSALVRGEHKTAEIVITNMQDPDSTALTEILFSVVSNSAKILSVEIGPVEKQHA